MVCRGASGYLDEVNEDRKVKNRVISALQSAGHTVYDCTDGAGKTQGRNLASIVAKCNAHAVDLDVSIHLNAGGGKGVEVWCYGEKTEDIAAAICANISATLGIPNRGVKYTHNLYVLRKTHSPAILIECCFVDSQNDASHWDADKCGDAIASAIAGKTDEEIVATREKAIKVLKEKGYEIVNTLFTDEWYSADAMKERGVVQIPLCFLAKSLENMSLCHAAYFCKGWENARGCRIEHDASVAYGLDIIYEE